MMTTHHIDRRTLMGLPAALVAASAAQAAPPPADNRAWNPAYADPGLLAWLLARVRPA